MTTEEKKQLALIAKLAIERMDLEALTQDETGLYEALLAVPEFVRLCNAGLHEALVEVGFDGVIDRDAMVTMSIKQLLGSVSTSVTIGMDLAIMMSRYGAKFPKRKEN